MDNFKNTALIVCLSTLPVVGYLWYINSDDNNVTDNPEDDNNVTDNSEDNNEIIDTMTNDKLLKKKQNNKIKTKSKKKTSSGVMNLTIAALKKASPTHVLKNKSELDYRHCKMKRLEFETNFLPTF